MFTKIFENSVNWNEFIPKTKDTIFLKNYGDKINWILYFKHFPKQINLKFYLEFYDYFNTKVIDYVSKKIILTNDVLINKEKFNEKILFTRKEVLTLEPNLLNYEYISNMSNLPVDFVNENIDKLKIKKLKENRTLTKKIIQENPTKFISEKTNKFTKDIVSYIDFDFDFILNNRQLFSNKDLISYQTLTTSFVENLLNENKNLEKDIDLARIPTLLSKEFITPRITSESSKYEFTRYQIARSPERISEMWGILKESVLYEYRLVNEEFIKNNLEKINKELLFKYSLEDSYGIINNNNNYEEICSKYFKTEYDAYLENIVYDEEFDYAVFDNEYLNYQLPQDN